METVQVRMLRSTQASLPNMNALAAISKEM